jgi:hypothetical protein
VTRDEARAHPPDPCTQEAFEEGCTCHVPSAHSAQIDPPEPRINKYCPLHGFAPDPDEAYERWRDDKLDFPEDNLTWDDEP